MRLIACCGYLSRGAGISAELATMLLRRQRKAVGRFGLTPSADSQPIALLVDHAAEDLAPSLAHLRGTSVLAPDNAISKSSAAGR